MTKRLLAMVLVCILAIPILAIPASATSGGVTGTQFDMFATALGNLLNSIESTAISWWDAINKNMVSWFDAINDNMIFWLNNINTGIGNVYGGIQTVINNIVSYGDKISGYVYTIKNNIANWWQEQIAVLNEIKTYFLRLFSIDWTYSKDGFFYRVYERLDKLVNGNEEFDSDVDQIGDDIADSDDKYHDSMDIVQSATRPVFDDVYIEYEGLVGGNGLEATIYGEMLALLFVQGGYFYHILFVAFTLAMVSFVVFGKR